MKTLLFSLAALALSAAAGTAQMATVVRPTDIKLDKISPAVVKTPEIQFTNGAPKRSTPGSWLEVEVEFTTAPEMIDELTFNYKMLINGKLVVGDITHVDIPKGREHFSVAYLAPRSLESLMGGKQMTGASIGGVWVDVSHQGQVLATLGSMRGLAVPNVPQIQNLVLNKSQTPFAPLYWDRYEAIKPTGGR